MIVQGDARRLDMIDDASVDLVVTSPPYLMQRRYGSHPDEIGICSSVAEYVEQIVDVFAELRRVMRPGSSSAWLNIGDKANGSGGAGGDWKPAPGRRLGGGPGKYRDPRYPDGSYLDVPGAVVAGLLDEGWRLRASIVWDKGRNAPESLRHVGRPLVSHEMIYLLTPWTRPARPRFYPSQLAETGSVWHFPPGGSGPAHLAPFPDELARRCILPTTLPGDLVLDPFGGSHTVHRVAEQLGRRAISVELYHDRDELRHGA
jgi:site-specific DNA-methyltransferase (cytosine-N4-specific)